MRVKNGLMQDQEQRLELDPESAKKVEEFLTRLEKYIELESPWTLKLNDPSGNCFIQNPDPMHVDPHCITSHYYRGALYIILNYNHFYFRPCGKQIVGIS